MFTLNFILLFELLNCTAFVLGEAEFAKMLKVIDFSADENLVKSESDYLD